MDERTKVKPTVLKKSRSGKGKLIALIASACAVVIVAGGYLGLCAWAGGHILPHSTAAGVELGGLSRQAAEQTLEEAAQDYQGKTITLAMDDTRIICELDRAGLSFDTEGVLAQLDMEEQGFLARGAAWLGAMFSDDTHEAQDPLYFENQSYLNGLIASFNTALDQPVIQHDFQIEDTYILLTRGQAGMSVNAEGIENGLLEQLVENDFSDYPLTPQITEPDDPDFEALSQQVYVEPTNASLSADTYEFTPSVTGVSLDPAVAQALFERTAPGESCEIPLELTEPEITTEQLSDSLFGDLLGEANSTVGGTSNRVSNVRLAGTMCNGTILLPGETFSYWDKIGPCTASQGFLPAPSYQNGLTVDTTGGGICQMSSSIYYAALLSNLEIVERRNHSFAVGYLPDGADATVSGGNPDFKFRNNTKFPIKIVVNMQGTSLSVQIWGTKTDDTYVKMEFVRLSTTNPTTVYKIDNSVPAGSTRVSVTPYTGRVVEAYRCIYNGDGTLQSKKLESTNYYQKRDQVVLVNSADAAKYGLAPDPAATTAPEPSASAQPTPTPTPQTTPTPNPQTTPSPTPQPTPTPQATPEPTPIPTPPPAPSEPETPPEEDPA